MEVMGKSGLKEQTTNMSNAQRVYLSKELLMCD